MSPSETDRLMGLYLFALPRITKVGGGGQLVLGPAVLGGRVVLGPRVRGDNFREGHPVL